MAKKPIEVEEATEYPKTFVAENGETVVAQNEAQAAAFKNAGLKEE